jgi:hypothetical protein
VEKTLFVIQVLVASCKVQTLNSRGLAEYGFWLSLARCCICGKCPTCFLRLLDRLEDCFPASSALPSSVKVTMAARKQF